ncbi:MAG: CAAX prenyl protease-related protein [Desulfohalobiaceae bacterium]
MAPFALFALLTYAPELLGISQAASYSAKTVLVGLLLILLWKTFRPEIRPALDWLAVLAGIGVFALWVGLEGWYPLLGEPQGFEPFALTSTLAGAWTLILFRMLGAVLVVPVMEEIFWRSFGLRALIDSNFRRLPLGSFSWFAFIAVSVAFGLAHHRWLPGIIAGLVYAALLFRSRNLFAPILSHAVTNFLLGVYVMWSNQWEFW